MKKIIAAASSLCLALSFSLAVPTAAQAAFDDGNAKDAVGFCKALNAAHPEVSVGTCVGILRANEAPAVCRLLDVLGVLDIFDANRGNCVSYIRHLN